MMVLTLRSTEQSGRNSSILRLPGELRNMIYVCVLHEDGYTIRDAPLPGCRSGTSHVPHRLAILCVCAQIYQEAVLIPFALNVFTFGSFVILNNLRYTLTYSQRCAISFICIRIELLQIQTDLGFLKDTNRPDDWQLSRVLPRVQFLRVHMPALVGFFFFFPPRKLLRTVGTRQRGEGLLRAWHSGSRGDFGIILN
jgi:hypothetical protein